MFDCVYHYTPDVRFVKQKICRFKAKTDETINQPGAMFRPRLERKIGEADVKTAGTGNADSRRRNGASPF